MTDPVLTAVVLVDSQRERGARALEALCAQSIIDRMEILVMDCGGHVHEPLRGSDHPAVRVIRAETAMGYGGVMAMAVAGARAPVVACVEEHVVVLEGWAHALVEAHKGPWAAVCGELHPGTVDRVELMGRHHWNVPGRRGESALLRWRNVCYKRASLMRYGDKLPLLLGAESLLFRQLRHDGDRLFIEPEVRVVHAHGHSWRGFVAGSFHCARLDAARAALLSDAGPFERLVQVGKHLAGPVRWPWVLWRRTRSLPHPEQWMPLFYRSLLCMAHYYIVLAAGGAVGALAGEGDSDRQYLSYEINDGPWKPTTSTQL